jgi:hypothetical protein
MVKPISPDEIVGLKKTIFPDAVIETWNLVIAKNYIEGSSRFTQDEIMAALVETLKYDRATIFDLKYLDVEDIYRAEGWSVEYDRPGYNESYAANFTFRKKK